MFVDFVLGSDLFASQLASSIGANYVPVDIKEYPECDQKPKIESDFVDLTDEYLKERNILLALRDDRLNPDSNRYHMRNWLVLDTLKRIGTRRIGVLAPYMHYSRQDEEFLPGEPLSLKTIGKIYESFKIDYFITVNSHVMGKPEGKNLSTFFPKTDVHDIDPVGLFADSLKQMDIENPIVVGPDEGSIPMIKRLSKALGCPPIILKAKRDRVSELKKIGAGEATRENVEGTHPIVYDDLTGTGGTLLHANNVLKGLGSLDPYIAVVHLYSRVPLERLANTGVTRILTTDSFYLKPELRREFNKHVNMLTLVPTVSDYILDEM